MIRPKEEGGGVYSWPLKQAFFFTIIMHKVTIAKKHSTFGLGFGNVFNCSSHFSVPKRKITCSQPERLFHEIINHFWGGNKPNFIKILNIN